MANFVGRRNANDTFIGTTAADNFTFAPIDLTSGDTINGGSGTAIDTLIFSATGAVTASSLTHVSMIERINLYAGGNSLSFGDAFALANAPLLAIFGGAGNDKIDAKAATRIDRAIDVTAGGGDDTLSGGAGDDIYRFAIADLTLGDTINGGGGSNTLHLTGGGAMTSMALSHVSHMNVIDLDAAASLQLSNNVVSYNGVLDSQSGFTVEHANGSSGIDTIDGSAVSNANNSLYISGGHGADVLKGGAGSDVFLYASGDAASGETVDGRGGTNVVRATGTNDFSHVTLSNIDTLQFASGTTVLTAAQYLAFHNIMANEGGFTNEAIKILDYNAVIDLNAPTLYYFASGDSIAVVGTDGVQTIVAANGVTTNIDARGGNDVIRSGGGYGANSVVSGGDGDDRIDYADVAGLVLDGGTGNNTLTTTDFFGGGIVAPIVIQLASTGDETIGDNTTVTGFENVDWSGTDIYSYRALQLTGDASANSVTGGGGDDVIDGAGGLDVIDGGAGNDRIVYHADAKSIDGGNGSDLLVLTGTANVDLNAADETIGDTAVVAGFEGVDASTATSAVTIKGNNAGYGTIIGGKGSDHLTAGASGDELDGGAGNDVLTGSAAGDVFHGGPGKDTMIGGDGGDIFYIDKGDYTAGESIVAGGNDGDQLGLGINAVADFTTGTLSGLQFINLADGASLTVTGAQIAGVDQIFDNGGLTSEHLTIDLTPGVTTDLGQMRLTGFESEDVVTVNASGGNDSIILPFGTTTFHGLAGDDTIGFNQNYYDYSNGSDIYGDDGNDRIQYLSGQASNTTIIDGGAGTDTLVDAVNDAWMNDQIDLSQTADQSIGDYTTVTGFENIDWSGSESSLTAMGDGGANRIIGGGGNDVLNGGAGNDVLKGGIGGGTEYDTLTGGTGADMFILEFSNVHVTDFRASDGDTLGFDDARMHFNSSTPTRVTASSTSTHIAGADLVIYTGGVLDDNSDAEAFLDATDGKSTGDSMFIVGKNSAGDTMLYYTSAAGVFGVSPVADLGNLTSPTAITTSMFHFGV